MRLFIGIPLAQDVKDALQSLTRSLQSANDNLRWSSSESWHITLQFLGETSEESHRCVVTRLQEVLSAEVPVRLDGTGFFERAGVFFAGVRVSTGMLELEKRILAATARCGFVAEDRPFHPHVTLARAKGDKRMNALQKLKQRVKGDVTFPAFTASEFLLYEASLGAGGPRYEIRNRFPLGKR